jgi:hypothetical protein
METFEGGPTWQAGPDIPNADASVGCRHVVLETMASDEIVESLAVTNLYKE